MKRNSCLVLFLGIYFFSQAHNPVSIYELGDPIKSYEDNFKNLVRNWKKEYITNAERYTLKEIYLVEVINGSERYNYWRNYFTSDKPVSRSMSKRTGVDAGGNCSAQSGASGSINQASDDDKEKRIYELIIEPGYLYSEFYDSRGMSKEIQAILTDDFQREARELLARELNIDTLQLHSEQHYEEVSDTTDIGYSTTFTGYNITSSSPLSQNYKDIKMNNTKTIFDFSLEDARSFILEDLLIERITRQVAFTQTVHPGDRVYAIEFEYGIGRAPYTCHVVCSRETKKVVFDLFFNIFIE